MLPDDPVVEQLKDAIEVAKQLNYTAAVLLYAKMLERYVNAMDMAF